MERFWIHLKKPPKKNPIIVFKKNRPTFAGRLTVCSPFTRAAVGATLLDQ